MYSQCVQLFVFFNRIFFLLLLLLLLLLSSSYICNAFVVKYSCNHAAARLSTTHIGYSRDSNNVTSKKNVKLLKGVRSTNAEVYTIHPYCSISVCGHMTLFISSHISCTSM